MKKITFVCAALLMAACGGSGSDASTSESNALNGQPAGDGTASARVQTLSCTTGRSFESFSATLDASGFDVGSGLFRVTNARIVDNYATAQLLCTGNTLAEIDCVGFWFGIGSEVVEVTTTKGDDGLTASYAPLKGNLVKMITPPWACTVK